MYFLISRFYQILNIFLFLTSYRRKNRWKLESDSSSSFTLTQLFFDSKPLELLCWIIVSVRSRKRKKYLPINKIFEKNLWNRSKADWIRSFGSRDKFACVCCGHLAQIGGENVFELMFFVNCSDMRNIEVHTCWVDTCLKILKKLHKKSVFFVNLQTSFWKNSAHFVKPACTSTFLDQLTGGTDQNVKGNSIRRRSKKGTQKHTIKKTHITKKTQKITSELKRRIT